MQLETVRAAVEVIPTTLRPQIDEKRCTGCGRCVSACGERRFTFQVVENRKYAVILGKNECTDCRKCIEECPVQAISL